MSPKAKYWLWLAVLVLNLVVLALNGVRVIQGSEIQWEDAVPILLILLAVMSLRQLKAGRAG